MQTQILNVLESASEDAQNLRAEKWRPHPCPTLPPEGQVRWGFLDLNSGAPNLEPCALSLRHRALLLQTQGDIP